MTNTAQAVEIKHHNTLSGFQISRLKEAVDGLTNEQISWASGYLAGLREEVSMPPQTNTLPEMTILYASQGGNARNVAEGLATSVSSQGLIPRLISVADYRPRELNKEKLLIVVISTQGEGEPPENARALFNYLNGKKPPKIVGLKYAIFGLGDSSYEQFCQAAKELDQQLSRLGAVSVIERIDADIDFQTQTGEWYKQIAALAGSSLPTEQARIISLPRHAPVVNRYDRNYPYSAEVLENRPITTLDAVAKIHHLALEVDANLLTYKPGDALGVLLRNNPLLVSEILSLSGLSGEHSVNFQEEPTSLTEALTDKLELTQLHPSVVTKWASLTANAKLDDIISNRDELRLFASQHQFIDLLLSYPVQIDAAGLINLLHPIQPRLYSISSSQAVYDDEIHLTVSTLHYHARGRDYLGGASGHLTQRTGEGDALSIYVAENPGFRLPKNDQTPIIMIGAGTGIAPYRAFLQEREVQGSKGQNWLVFGNRHFHRDFLYQTDWLKYRKQGVLNKVSVAFSRDSAQRHYVQDQLLAEGAELYRWLQDGAHLYVCGGIAMEKAVCHTLQTIAHTQGGLAPTATHDFIEELRSQGRYQRDVY
ncbi:MAG: flavodoxin domain-containing protein [Candidatus Thiodiazotropha sp. (ex Cardiolucina cf. quadrata)]|nr:flavodoxin domain-containing protein [Candidatus Thiodiazotropha sp. (ex Cardiolucina cf. quadrata)]